MQIVIDIHEDVYEDAINGIPNGLDQYSNEVIRNGIPLPKGHGRLIDANDVDNHIIGSVDLRDCPTIVEADKK